MTEPPNKRQRLSPDAHKVGEDTAHETSDHGPNPITPTRRASYISPTKASLARSHPDLLAKSPKRGSLTEPRGKLLREQLLGSKIRSNDELRTTKTASGPRQDTIDDVSNRTADGPALETGFAEAIAKSFSATTTTPNLDTDRSRRSARSPLRARQPSNTTADKQSPRSKPSTASLDTLPTPRLVTRGEGPTLQRSEHRNEPELPPTPVQLGIGSAPDRPKGLASSSSIGSKNGSGRNRRRVRERGGGPVTSSPLKPKNTRPMSPTDFSDIEDEDNHEFVNEAPASVPDHTTHNQRTLQVVDLIDRDPDSFPEELRDRAVELVNLRFELEKLKDDMAKIESLADQLQDGGDLVIEQPTLELLNIGSQVQSGNSQSPNSHPLFITNPSAYLQLFAPGDLRLGHETSTKSIESRRKIIHKLTLTAPPPWPSDTTIMSLSVQIDTEDARLEHLTETAVNGSWDDRKLCEWMNYRLASDLHKFDVGGLIWGASQYFEACITRAKVFKELDEKFNRGGHTSHLQQKQINSSDTDIPLSLFRYIHETQMVVSHASNDGVQTRQSSSRSTTAIKQIILSYDIVLGWTGDAAIQAEVSLTGVNGKAVKGARELFQRLLVTEGVVGAFEAVWKLVFDL